MRAFFSIAIFVISMLMWHIFFSHKLSILQNKITFLKNRHEPWQDASLSNQTSRLQEITQKIMFNQHQLSALIQSMHVHPKIMWHLVEIQKGKIIVSGYVNQIEDLFHFMQESKTTLSKVKVNTKLHWIEFQLYLNRVDLNVKRDELA